MFRIRQEQLRAFQEYKERQFVREVNHEIHETYHEYIKDVPEDTILELVRRAIQKAETYGITGKIAVKRFIFLIFELHQEFYNLPSTHWMQQVLHHKKLKGGEKVEALWATLLTVPEPFSPQDPYC